MTLDPRAQSSSPNRVRTAAVLGCLLLCLAWTVWGFARTNVVKEGLLAVWDRPTLERFLIYLGLVVVTFAAAAFTRAPRATQAVLAIVWLCLTFGMDAVAAVAGIFGAALGLGSVVAGPAALRQRFGQHVGALLTLVAGLAVLLAVVQVLAHFPINTPQLYVLLLSVGVLTGRRWLLADARALLGYLAAPIPRRASILGPTLILTVLSLHTMHAALPERMFDAVAMHLTVPTYVASHQQWMFDPSLYSWGLIPMGADWLYTVGYLLGGEAASRLLNVGLHAAAVTLLYLELREALPPLMASLLAAVYSATPLAFVESASLYIENTLSLFLMAATVLLARSWRNHRWEDAGLLALLLGGALATKLLAAFAAVAIFPLAAYSLARSVKGKRLAIAFVAGALVVLATGGVPYLYAWKAAGNPVLPLANHIFQSPHFPVIKFTDARYMGHLGPGILFDATFRSARFGENLDGCFGFQHLLFLPAGAIAVALSRRRASWIPLVVGLVYCAGVLWNIQYLRYLYPVFPLLALVEAETALSLAGSQIARAGVTALALSALVANLAFMATSGWTVQGFHTEALFSSEARQRLLDETLPQRSLLRLATAMDGKRVRVLEIGDPVGVDLEGEAIYTTWHSPAPATRLWRAQTAGDVAKLAFDYRITYVLQDRRVRVHPAVLSFLVENATLVQELGDQRLYRLRTAPR